MNHARKNTLLTILVPALSILFLLTVQAIHFHERSYRQDEAWVVHYAIENIERIGLANHLLQVFQLLPPENFLQDIWVYAFGHIENIVRFLSTLTTFMTLAMFYRLASDVFDHQTGRLAVTILGTLSIFMFFTHEARPYAALSFGTVGFQWMLLRFIRNPKPLYFILALCLSVIPFYQHPFLIYVFAGQVICVLIFVRKNRDLYVRGIALFVALGLLIAWRIVINYAEREGVITYGTATSLEGFIALYHDFKFNPESLGIFLFGLGLFLPIKKLGITRQVDAMLFSQAWRKWWIISALVVILTLVMGLNVLVESVTPRNLIIIAPYLALIVAYGLRHLPWQAQLIAVLMFIVPYTVQFRWHAGNAGYPELAQYMQDNYDNDEGRIVVIANQSWEWIPIKYYLDERTSLGLSNDSILYVSMIRDEPFMPQQIDPVNAVIGSRSKPSNEQFEHLPAYLGDKDKLWVIKGNPFKVGDYVQNWIDEHYTIYQRTNFPGESYYRPLEVIEYRRNPENSDDVVRFGEDITLSDWQLNQAVEVKACQTISVDTWWQTNITSDTLYSSTLVLTDANGQAVINADDMPGGIFMTPLWQPDDLYFDERSVTIPCDTPAGEYLLLLGFYDIETVENLPVNTIEGEPMGTNLFYLTTLFVE